MRWRIVLLLTTILAGTICFPIVFSFAEVSSSEETLTVEVMPEFLEVKSFQKFNVYVTVSEGLFEEVPGAEVTLASDGGGTASPSVGIADEEGFVTFAFTAPSVMNGTKITITAKVTAYGFPSAEGKTTVTVDPRELSVEITTSSAIVESGTTSKAVAYVRDGVDAVEGAQVTLSSDGVSFSQKSGLTDSRGTFQSDFTPSNTQTVLNLTITAVATKSGYIDGLGQASLQITPGQAQNETTLDYGSIGIIVLIVLGAVVVVFLALVKAKILVIGDED